MKTTLKGQNAAKENIRVCNVVTFSRNSVKVL
jgi:hypothetical protein